MRPVAPKARGPVLTGLAPLQGQTPTANAAPDAGPPRRPLPRPTSLQTRPGRLRVLAATALGAGLERPKVPLRPSSDAGRPVECPTCRLLPPPARLELETPAKGVFRVSPLASLPPSRLGRLNKSSLRDSHVVT